jgi:hypothetical protein
MPASSMVTTNSNTRIGCTRAIGPVPNAAACSRKPTVIATTPPTHTGWCTRCHSMRMPMPRLSGSRRAPLRCSTDAVALAAEASTASTTLSITPVILLPVRLGARSSRRFRSGVSPGGGG